MTDILEILTKEEMTPLKYSFIGGIFVVAVCFWLVGNTWYLSIWYSK